MKYSCYALTDIGNVRSNNEDAFILREVWDGRCILAVVVDGVGGNMGGDIAANLACRCIEEDIVNAVDKSNCAEILMASVVRANNVIISQQTNPWLSRMSCVLTAALIDLKSNEAYICHVGDTRLYVIERDELVKVTRDHSIVGPLEESGEITEEQAMRHPRRNVITRSVGKRQLLWDNEYVQTHTVRLESCSVLLCSDGLYDMVPSKKMAEIITDKIDLQERVEKLVGAANEAGGKDNITVILIDLKSEVKED